MHNTKQKRQDILIWYDSFRVELFTLIAFILLQEGEKEKRRRS